jgi:mannitol-1-phosphate/altronate dehydrogenase
MSAEHVFTGFGFGPIQGGLFAKEAFQSGSFTRIAVAEVDAGLVNTVRANKGSYYVNIAKTDGIETLRIDDVELLNPNVAADRRVLLEALTQSTEIVTCLPSVSLYQSGEADSIASLIAEGLKNSRAEAAIIYTAENNNHAAEILEKAVREKNAALPQEKVQFLNTVIGKMSRVVTDPAEIAELKLKAIAPGLERAFLVEQFNRILVSRTKVADFKPGIEVFIEKDDLLPFEEAKLYGHNAIHSLLGFIGAVKGAESMVELKDDKAVMQIGRDAFLEESGAALIKKYAYLGDELFTEAGYKDYAEDLLVRMTNPFLGDTIARVTRDVVRKLEMDGRIFGTMQLALEYGIEPKNMALGAMAGIVVLLQRAGEYDLPDAFLYLDWRKLNEIQIERILDWLWNGRSCRQIVQIIKSLKKAKKYLGEMAAKENW